MATEPATQVPDWPTADDENRSSGEVASLSHGSECGRSGFHRGGLHGTDFIRDRVQGFRRGHHVPGQSAICLKANRPL